MSVLRVLMTALLGAVASTALLAVPASAVPTPAAPSQASLQSAVIKLTNAERAKAGCAALTSNAALNKAAQRHSSDMVQRHFTGHIGSNGSTLVTRAEAAGYTGWRALAENVAGGQPTAARVVKSWMKSPEHRANILNCSLRDIGVGYAKKHGTYWTQEFGAKF
nr:CAP domain-containing protein [Streptomyces canus]